MVIEVKRRGSFKQERICGVCDAVLTFDVRTDVERTRTFEDGERFWIACPDCGGIILLGQHEVLGGYSDLTRDRDGEDGYWLNERSKEVER